MTAQEVADWDSCRVQVMREALRLKFQNPGLRLQVLGTGERLLVERITTGRGGDKFWGTSKAKGHGCNVLGCLLMELRSELKAGL